MKHLWLWILFILAYGLLSMKSHAAEAAARTAEPNAFYPLDLSARGQ